MSDLWTDDLLAGIYNALDRSVQEKARCGFRRIYDPWTLMRHFRLAIPDCEHTVRGKVDAAIIHGYINEGNNASALDVAFRQHVPVVLTENGFISSAASRMDEKVPARFRLEHSLVVDTRGQFFDATRPTDLEIMLNTTEVSPEQRDEARRLMDRIVSNKVTMFNHQPIFTLQRDKKRVLVVDQTYRDFSVTRGMADDLTFKRMLEAACDENPDSDVLVKTHPFVMAGRQGYYSGLLDQGRIKKVTFPINPYSLLDCCDKVYVCTSNLGFDALLAGKEVHTFGMPYYAGWGLTKDELKCERRTRRLTVEELFYIFAVKYTRWVDPEKGCATSLDSVIDKMVTMRKEMGVKGA